MRSLQKTALAAVLFGLGYLAGTAHTDQIPTVHAQGTPDANAPSDAVAKEISTVYAALQSAKDILSQEGRYAPATKTLNVSGIVAGGVDALADLEAGRGVDPETFAALYADQASDDIRPEIGTDEHGRLTYKGKVIRMYSVSRLKQMYQERLRYTGETDAEPVF
ncbi:MAG: hypothetical protein ACYTGL_19015 [Planctomycetota bacterium]|jgi:hypothetical protein